MTIDFYMNHTVNKKSYSRFQFQLKYKLMCRPTTELYAALGEQQIVARTKGVYLRIIHEW